VRLYSDSSSQPAAGRANPLVALRALVQKKLGRMSFAELGATLALRRSTDLSIAYMGFAVRSLRA
jgi:2-polyprenyl-6-hydroxyphenyl methylase / 3-demethylubiquinone-9 3-methyltransferase